MSSRTQALTLLTINVLLLNFSHILESVKDVAENVDEVKDITQDTNIKIEKGFDKAQGKHFSLSF